MKFRQLFKSSIISLNLGKYMVNIVYEVLFSSTLAHKKFSICLTCTMAVHRYFLQLSKSSLCLPFLRKRQILAGKKNFFICSEIRKTKMALEVSFSFSCFPNSCCVQKEATTFLCLSVTTWLFLFPISRDVWYANSWYSEIHYIYTGHPHKNVS